MHSKRNTSSDDITSCAVMFVLPLSLSQLTTWIMPRAYIDTVQVIETTTESIGGGVFRFAKANGDTAVAYCRSCCRVANVVAAASAAVAIAVQYLKEIQTCVLSYIRHLQANCKHRVC